MEDTSKVEMGQICAQGTPSIGSIESHNLYCSERPLVGGLSFHGIGGFAEESGGGGGGGEGNHDGNQKQEQVQDSRRDQDDGDGGGEMQEPYVEESAQEDSQESQTRIRCVVGAFPRRKTVQRPVVKKFWVAGRAREDTEEMDGGAEGALREMLRRKGRDLGGAGGERGFKDNGCRGDSVIAWQGQQVHTSPFNQRAKESGSAGHGWGGLYGSGLRHRKCPELDSSLIQTELNPLGVFSRRTGIARFTSATRTTANHLPVSEANGPSEYLVTEILRSLPMESVCEITHWLAKRFKEDCRSARGLEDPTSGISQEANVSLEKKPTRIPCDRTVERSFQVVHFGPSGSGARGEGADGSRDRSLMCEKNCRVTGNGRKIVGKPWIHDFFPGAKRLSWQKLGRKDSVRRGQTLCGLQDFTLRQGVDRHVVAALLAERKDGKGSACFENCETGKNEVWRLQCCGDAWSGAGDLLSEEHTTTCSYPEV